MSTETETETTKYLAAAGMLAATAQRWNGYNAKPDDLYIEMASRLDAAGLLMTPEIAVEWEQRFAAARTEVSGQHDDLVHALGRDGDALEWSELLEVATSYMRVAEGLESSADAAPSAEIARLESLVAAMHAASVGCERLPLLGYVDDVALTRTALLAQQHRAEQLDVIARRQQARVTALETERHSTNDALAQAHVRLAELEAAQAGPVFPWVQWLSADDQAAFLDEVGAASITYADTAHALEMVEERVARWRTAALANRPAQAPPLAFTSYLAAHIDGGMRLGQYTSRAAAMDHVHNVIAREENTTAAAIELRVVWRADDPEAADPEWECHLADEDGADDVTTGYTVGPVMVAAAYDPDGDE